MSTPREKSVPMVLAGLTVLAGFWASACMSADPVSSPPSVVLVFSDDHGAEDLGAYGNDVVRTANLDRLAAEGLRFTHAFTTTAMCTPSRSSLYTGLYPHSHGSHMNHGSVRSGILTMPDYLRPLGYRVGLAGKRHVKPAEQFPFEYMELDPEAIRRFVTADAGQPFVLIVAPKEPHIIEFGFPETERFSPDGIPMPPYLVDTLDTRRQRAGYYELIARLDEKIGQVIGVLEDEELFDKTVFIYASDHGAGFAFEKWTCYEAGLRVPLLVRWPGQVRAGRVTEAMVSLVDLLPTLIEIAGGAPSKPIDGRSFLSVLQEKADEHRSHVYGAHTNQGIIKGSAYPVRSIRSRTHKYIRNLNPEGTFTNLVTEDGIVGWRSWLDAAATDPSAATRTKLYQRRPAEELYDLTVDPYELNNLAAEPALGSVLENLRAELDRWMSEEGDRGLEAELAVPPRESVSAARER